MEIVGNLSISGSALVDHVYEVSSGHGVAIDGLTIKDSGFAIGSDTDGDMYYRSSGVLTRLAKGTGSQTLKMNSGATAPELKKEGKLSAEGKIKK